jgi:hypothetical protein
VQACLITKILIYIRWCFVTSPEQDRCQLFYAEGGVNRSVRREKVDLRHIFSIDQLMDLELKQQILRFLALDLAFKTALA